ncbi:hypothetical protein FQN57_002609 [Myotisia sp. PD_48]|nr:hypothetical protein FQN57_002609 [Myotisia sp. PD_48]
MAGIKRTWDGGLVLAPAMAESTTSNVQDMFTGFRNELDEHHDRRERIVKASRDITALSKKIIFSLQRVRGLNAQLPANIAKETNDRFLQIRELFNSISTDTSGVNAWRYQYQISPGIQEYIEALSFQRYIEKKEIISRKEISDSLPPSMLVTDSDYVLGLYDLTGEMMRFAITSMSSGAGRLATATKDGESTGSSAEELPLPGDALVSDLRQLRVMFEQFNAPAQGPWKEVNRKIETMRASVEKVERAVYGLLVRGKERPPGWVPDLSSAPAVEC